MKSSAKQRQQQQQPPPQEEDDDVNNIPMPPPLSLPPAAQQQTIQISHGGRAVRVTSVAPPEAVDMDEDGVAQPPAAAASVPSSTTPSPPPLSSASTPKTSSAVSRSKSGSGIGGRASPRPRLAVSGSNFHPYSPPPGSPQQQRKQWKRSSDADSAPSSPDRPQASESSENIPQQQRRRTQPVDSGLSDDLNALQLAPFSSGSASANQALQTLLPLMMAAAQNLIVAPRSPLAASMSGGIAPLPSPEEFLRPHGLVSYTFHNSNHVAPARGSNMQWVSTRNAIYGLECCRERLERTIGVPSRFPHMFQTETHSPSHFLYFHGREGSGFRLLLANYCRENNLNFISVRDVRQYEVGLYKNLIQYAAERMPAVVLIDRIDHHWLKEAFSHTGNELFSQWQGFLHQYHLQQLEKHSGEESPTQEFAFPPLWFVITSSSEFHSIHPYLVEKIGSENTAWTDTLKKEQYLAVMRSIAQRWLEDIGFPKDLPDPALMQIDRAKFAAQLDASQLYRLLSRYQLLFDACVTTWMQLQEGTNFSDPGSRPCVAPGQANGFVDRAFRQAFNRCAANQQFMQERVRRLPTFYDFVAVADLSLHPWRLELNKRRNELEPTLPTPANTPFLQQQAQNVPSPQHQ
jgi:hypothetical protein